MAPVRPHRPTARPRLVILATVAAGALGLAAPALGAPADGTDQASAAASCWEIKQTNPAATDGLYWLMTPKLQRPQRFHCDMTTDGGGWVLVGRGRDGWRSEYEGQGTHAQVIANVDGPAAFRTRQLSGVTIDALLNGGRVDALQDGIRLRRAMNTTGSTWQEVRFNLQGRDRWTWTFRARHVVTSPRFDGVASSSGQRSNNFGSDNLYRRVTTDITAAQGWSGGFAFGSSISGTPDASSYLWSYTSGVGYARPFTQVYLRPRLMTADLAYPVIPQQGAPAVERAPLAESRTLPTVWGVNGLANGSGELRTEVQDFAQIGDYMFVGGNFRYVQRDRNGADRQDQSYLAAFNVHTREWLPTFRPVLNNQVKALVALPDGRLAVGGEFNQANGQPVDGFVILDPQTGATSPGFDVRIENRVSGLNVAVRSLKVRDGFLYLGGSFTHFSGGGDPLFRYMKNAARINASTGRPATDWNPNLNGTVNEIEPSMDGTRVYAAGYFTQSGSAIQRKLAAFSSAPGAALIPWTPVFSVPATQTNTFQFSITESANGVWAGGSEHSFFLYNKADLSFRRGSISMAGGDFQTSVVDPSSNVAYAGCHCDDYIYEDTTAYAWPGSFAQGDKLGFVGAWDGDTGHVLPEFAPILKARNGYGAWASIVDSGGNLWIGGSFTDAIQLNGSNQWTGGFMVFPLRDAVAPPAPSGLTTTATGDDLVLSWTASPESGVTYDVIRDDRVVATTTGDTTVTLPRPTEITRYAVRAVDVADNASATTPVITYEPAVQPVETVVVERTSTWRYRYAAGAPDAGWTGTGFNDAAWSAGAGQFGFGSVPDLGTDILVGAPSPRPLAAHFRTTFDVANAAEIDEVRLTFIANDGIVVYVNGQEVNRTNMPEGQITENTYATAAPSAATAEANPITVTVPGSMLVDGANVIAAETHLNYRSTPNVAFHLTAITVE